MLSSCVLGSDVTYATSHIFIIRSRVRPRSNTNANNNGGTRESAFSSRKYSHYFELLKHTHAHTNAWSRAQLGLTQPKDSGGKYWQGRRARAWAENLNSTTCFISCLCTDPWYIGYQLSPTQWKEQGWRCSDRQLCVGKTLWSSWRGHYYNNYTFYLYCTLQNQNYKVFHRI